jgi:PleD family two-component response regulator
LTPCAGGDRIPRQFGARLQNQLRRGVDCVARIGSEEFAVVLPETGYDAALYRSKHSGRNRVTATMFNTGGE